MPRGSKDKYTAEQKRKAEHIEDSYEHKGLSKDEAEARSLVEKQIQAGLLLALPLLAALPSPRLMLTRSK